MAFMKFNEWVAKEKNLQEGKSGEFANFQWENEEDELLENQLGQMVDRILGLIHSLPAQQKNQYLERFIGELKNNIE